MGTLDGKIVLVTGGAQGIGRGIALALAGEGADVAVIDINHDKAKETADLVAKRGRRSIAIRANVRNADDVLASVKETVDRLGGVNILVNAAQTFPLGPILDLSEEVIISGVESGLYGTIRYMRACHPYLKGDGVIINLSSPASVSPSPAGTVGIYSAVKSGINALTRAAAVEWAPDGIRAFAVLPVGDSPANEMFLSDPATREHVLSAIPLRRIGDSEKDIGRVVAFLCGPDATFLTGILVPIDGGATFLR